MGDVECWGHRTGSPRSLGAGCRTTWTAPVPPYRTAPSIPPTSTSFASRRRPLLKLSMKHVKQPRDPTSNRVESEVIDVKRMEMFYELTVLCCKLVQARLVSDGASVAFLTPHDAKRTRHPDGLPAFTHWVTNVVVGTVASVLEVHGQVS